MEYSIYDAIQAWAETVCIVIRKENEEMIKEKLGKDIFNQCTIHFVYQWMDDYLPEWLESGHRLKPWWTGHAVLVCKKYIKWSFVVINADDRYGREWMKKLFSSLEDLNQGDFAMIWYPLVKTLSDSWSVNRGVCTTDEWKLVDIKEHHKIHYEGDTIHDEHGKELDPNTIVSINFWWFSHSFFDRLEEEFTKFLEEYWTDPKKEFYIPTVCNTLLQEWKRCFVYTSSERWSWVTHPEDKPALQNFLHTKVEEWYYPKALWK